MSLAAQKQIEATGQSRARIYSLSFKSKVALSLKEESIMTQKGIPLSDSGELLLKYISWPLEQRILVGYSQHFLKNYVPNQTYFLSQEQREHLFKIGQVEHLIRPAGTYARNIFNRLIIDLSWNSSRLEGNTYSLLETKRLIEFGETASGRNAAEAQMILNHKAAIEYLVNSVDEITFNRITICSLHALLSDNLLGDPSASGKIRQRAVLILASTYLPIDNPHLLNESLNTFLQKIEQIKDPFEQCFFALVHLSYMQVFEDVNKRTSRIAANIPLVKMNLKPLAFVDVDQNIYLKSLLGIYEKNDISLFRDLFVWAYERSTQRYSATQQSV